METYQEQREKPWGGEIIYTEPGLAYAGKIISVKAGCKLSLQYHTEKRETLCLISGEALLWLADNPEAEIVKVPMELNKGYTIVPPRVHRIEAVTDVVFLEASTPEVGTTVRLQDDYHRPDEIR